MEQPSKRDGLRSFYQQMFKESYDTRKEIFGDKHQEQVSKVKLRYYNGNQRLIEQDKGTLKTQQKETSRQIKQEQSKLYKYRHPYSSLEYGERIKNEIMRSTSNTTFLNSRDLNEPQKDYCKNERLKKQLHSENTVFGDIEQVRQTLHNQKRLQPRQMTIDQGLQLKQSESRLHRQTSSVLTSYKSQDPTIGSQQRLIIAKLQETMNSQEIRALIKQSNDLQTLDVKSLGILDPIENGNFFQSKELQIEENQQLNQNLKKVQHLQRKKLADSRTALELSPHASRLSKVAPKKENAFLVEAQKVPEQEIKNEAPGVSAVTSRETNIQLVIQGASGLGSYQEQSQTQPSHRDAATPLIAKSIDLRDGRSNLRSQADSRGDASKAAQSGLPSPMYDPGSFPPAGYYQSQILDLELNQISNQGGPEHRQNQSDQMNAVCQVDLNVDSQTTIVDLQQQPWKHAGGLLNSVTDDSRNSQDLHDFQKFENLALTKLKFLKQGARPTQGRNGDKTFSSVDGTNVLKKALLRESLDVIRRQEMAQTQLGKKNASRRQNLSLHEHYLVSSRSMYNSSIDNLKKLKDHLSHIRQKQEHLRKEQLSGPQIQRNQEYIDQFKEEFDANQINLMYWKLINEDQQKIRPKIYESNAFNGLNNNVVQKEKKIQIARDRSKEARKTASDLRSGYAQQSRNDGESSGLSHDKNQGVKVFSPLSNRSLKSKIAVQEQNVGASRGSSETNIIIEVPFSEEASAKKNARATHLEKTGQENRLGGRVKLQRWQEDVVLGHPKPGIGKRHQQQRRALNHSVDIGKALGKDNTNLQSILSAKNMMSASSKWQSPELKLPKIGSSIVGGPLPAKSPPLAIQTTPERETVIPSEQRTAEVQVNFTPVADTTPVVNDPQQQYPQTTKNAAGWGLPNINTILFSNVAPPEPFNKSTQSRSNKLAQTLQLKQQLEALKTIAPSLDRPQLSVEAVPTKNNVSSLTLAVDHLNPHFTGTSESPDHGDRFELQSPKRATLLDVLASVNVEGNARNPSLRHDDSTVSHYQEHRKQRKDRINVKVSMHKNALAYKRDQRQNLFQTTQQPMFDYNYPKDATMQKKSSYQRFEKTLRVRMPDSGMQSPNRNGQSSQFLNLNQDLAMMTPIKKQFHLQTKSKTKPLRSTNLKIPSLAHSPHQDSGFVPGIRGKQIEINRIMGEGLVTVTNQGEPEKQTISYLDKLQHKNETVNKQKQFVFPSITSVDPVLEPNKQVKDAAPKTRDAVSNVDMGPPADSREVTQTGDRDNSNPSSPTAARPNLEQSGKFECQPMPSKIEESQVPNSTANHQSSQEKSPDHKRSKLLQILEPSKTLEGSSSFIEPLDAQLVRHQYPIQDRAKNGDTSLSERDGSVSHSQGDANKTYNLTMISAPQFPDQLKQVANTQVDTRMYTFDSTTDPTRDLEGYREFKELKNDTFTFWPDLTQSVDSAYPPRRKEQNSPPKDTQLTFNEIQMRNKGFKGAKHEKLSLQLKLQKMMQIQENAYGGRQDMNQFSNILLAKNDSPGQTYHPNQNRRAVLQQYQNEVLNKYKNPQRVLNQAQKFTTNLLHAQSGANKLSTTFGEPFVQSSLRNPSPSSQMKMIKFQQNLSKSRLGNSPRHAPNSARSSATEKTQINHKNPFTQTERSGDGRLFQSVLNQIDDTPLNATELQLNLPDSPSRSRADGYEDFDQREQDGAYDSSPAGHGDDKFQYLSPMETHDIEQPNTDPTNPSPPAKFVTSMGYGAPNQGLSPQRDAKKSVHSSPRDPRVVPIEISKVNIINPQAYSKSPSLNQHTENSGRRDSDLSRPSQSGMAMQMMYAPQGGNVVQAPIEKSVGTMISKPMLKLDKLIEQPRPSVTQYKVQKDSTATKAIGTMHHTQQEFIAKRSCDRKDFDSQEDLRQAFVIQSLAMTKRDYNKTHVGFGKSPKRTKGEVEAARARERQASKLSRSDADNVQYQQLKQTNINMKIDLYGQISRKENFQSQVTIFDPYGGKEEFAQTIYKDNHQQLMSQLSQFEIINEQINGIDNDDEMGIEPKVRLPGIVESPLEIRGGQFQFAQHPIRKAVKKTSSINLSPGRLPRGTLRRNEGSLVSPKNNGTIQEVIMRKTGGKFHVGPSRNPKKVNKHETLKLQTCMQSESMIKINTDLDECKSPDAGNLQIVNTVKKYS